MAVAVARVVGGDSPASAPGAPVATLPAGTITGLYLPGGTSCGTLLFQAAPAVRRADARPLADGSGISLPAEDLCAIEVQPPPGTELVLGPEIAARFSLPEIRPPAGTNRIRLVQRPQQPGGPPPLPLDLVFRDRDRGTPRAPVRLVGTSSAPS